MPGAFRGALLGQFLCTVLRRQRPLLGLWSPSAWAADPHRVPVSASSDPARSLQAPAGLLPFSWLELLLGPHYVLPLVTSLGYRYPVVAVPDKPVGGKPMLFLPGCVTFKMRICSISCSLGHYSLPLEKPSVYLLLHIPVCCPEQELTRGTIT